MNYIDYTITKLVERLEDLEKDLSERGDTLSDTHIARLSDLRDAITLLIEAPEPRRYWTDIDA